MPGRIVKTVDSAFATFLYDTRMGKEGWNKGLLKMYKVDPKHMPEIIDCTDLAGGLTAKAADDLHPPPWLHGNRSPFEDSGVGGMFFNIRIENGKGDMIRAVLEGICYHLRWLLECETKKVKTADPIRFVGGGALSPVTCQMLADITGRTIETVDNTQAVGATGTALVVAAGIRGVDVLDLARQLVKADHAYTPDPKNKELYERNYRVFRKLYKANASNFRELNSAGHHGQQR